ncbi:MAG: VIT and VWA domain-containing protein [Planctomycetota bacterium]
MRRTIMTLPLIMLMVGISLAISPAANACGIIHIDRRPLPPDVQVSDISVKNTTLDVKIEEQVAMVSVDEIFHNPNNRQLEGTFILPILPETAVQNLSLWINGKENKAELLDRDKALQYYQEVVRRMIDPALLEYAGYGLLRLRVFPIPAAQQDLGQGPGNVRIKYSYTYRLPNDNGICVFRHPWGTNKFSSEAIDSAVIKATIKSAIPIKTVYSPTYSNIDVARKDDNNISLSFEQNKMKPDKDFILYYTLSEKQFGINMLTYKKLNADGFFMMMLSPKYEVKDNEVVKKDVVFVLDTSGSMADNGKIDQAKNSLNFCINSLKESDRFNLVTFSTEVRQLKNNLQEVTPAAREEALKWVKDVEARGGTNINDALISVLGMVEANSKRPFIVVFLTDGLPTVGETNMDSILKNVSSKNTANVRIFTFGVGYDVNTHLLDKMAEANRGAREYIIPGENIEVKVSNFYDKIAYPVLADVKLDVSNMEIYDRYPKNLPDLFRGTQLILFGRYKGSGNKLITLSGAVNGEARKFEYESTFAAQNEATDFIPRLWATVKVGYLMDEIRLRGETKEVKEEIVKIAMEYGILTPYTSYLVLEDTKTASAPQQEHMRGWRGDAPKEPGLLDKERKDMKADSGAGAVGKSRETNSMKKGDSSGAESDDALGRMVKDTVKQVADKTFYFTKGTWYDSKYDEKDTKTEKVTVKYLSDEYFALIAKQPQLAKYFAVGEKMVVCFGDKIYEVTKE